MDRAHTPIGSLLEQAASIVRRSKETAGTLEHAESYKGKQMEGYTNQIIGIQILGKASPRNCW